MKRRLPPIKVDGGFLHLRAFKFLPFSVYTASAFIGFLGLYTGWHLLTLNYALVSTTFNAVLTFIAVSSAKAGISPSFDVYFLAIANISSTAGRMLTGVLSSRIGKIKDFLVPTAPSDDARRLPSCYDPGYITRSGCNDCLAIRANIWKSSDHSHIIRASPSLTFGRVD